MDKQHPPVPLPKIRRRTTEARTTEDNTAGRGPRHLSRSTDRPAHTPRDARSGDHPSRPGALPPAPGRLPRALGSLWFPVLLLALFAFLTQQVLTDGPLSAVDHWVRNHIQHLAAARPAPGISGPHGLAEYWSDLGSSLVAVPLLALCAGIAAFRARRAGAERWWAPLATAALAAVVLLATVVPAKDAIARPGPAGNATGSTGLGYFPSGHTATATVCLATAVWLLAMTVSRLRARVLYALTAVLCLGVAAGLLWDGYHWLLDVIGAWALSGIILWCLARWAWRPDYRADS